MSKLIRRPHGRPTAPPKPPSADIRQLKLARQMIEKEEWQEAYALLLELEGEAPNDPDLLTILCDCAAQVNEPQSLLRVALKLRVLYPDHAQMQVKLASAYAEAGCPILSLRAWEELVERWPDAAEADDVRNAIAGFAPETSALFGSTKLTRAEAIDLMCCCEQASLLVAGGAIEDGLTMAQSVIEHWPHYLPAYDIIVSWHGANGDYDEAFEWSMAALNAEPDSDETLCNLVRISFHANRLDDAFLFAEKLKSRIGEKGASYVCIMEGQILVSDYEAVLQAYAAASKLDSPAIVEAEICHLAAVAEYRLEHHAAAKALWRRSVSLDPDYDLASANLDNLALKQSERHGPVPFVASYWFSQPLLGDLAKLLQKPEETSKADYENLLARHSAIFAIVPLIFDHADPETITMLAALARSSEDTRFLVPMEGFLSKSRGCKRLRQIVADVVGLLQGNTVASVVEKASGSESVQLRVAGKTYDVLAARQAYNIDPVARKVYDAAMEFHNKRRHKDAVNYLKYAIELAPGSPFMRNKLALLLAGLRRYDEAKRVVEETYSLFPDYVYARCEIAGYRVREGRVDEAKATVEPLLSRQQFRFAEFAALCQAKIEIHLFEDAIGDATEWGDALRSVMPDHDILRELRNAQRYRQVSVGRRRGSAQ